MVTRAPLSLPPDYGLRPPRPGAARPNEASPRDDAKEGLLRNLGNRGGRSSAKKKVPGHFTNGEAALLKRAEALNVDSKIREIVERESGRVVESDSLVDTLVFWKDKTPAQTLVDPRLEAERLRGNAALGKPATTGTTPIIKNSKGGLHAARDVAIHRAFPHATCVLDQRRHHVRTYRL